MEEWRLWGGRGEALGALGLVAEIVGERFPNSMYANSRLTAPAAVMLSLS